MDAHLRAVARGVKGFLPEAEGLALHAAGLDGARRGPLLEIGAYCGKSAVYLGAAARARGTVVFSVDHHHGSEENQAGWEHHDVELVDPATGRLDTLPAFRHTIDAAGLVDVVIPVVGESTVVARHWGTPLGLVFVDGGHGRAVVQADYDAWACHVAPGGLLAFHDVFEDPAAGGQAPFEVWAQAASSGAFTPVSTTGSLRVLRRSVVP